MISDFKKRFKIRKINKSKIRKKRYYDSTSVINMGVSSISNATISKGALKFEYVMEMLNLQSVMQTPLNRYR